MTKRKAFFVGFALTLAVLVPIYLTVIFVILTRTAPAETKKQGIPIRGPMAGDAKTILIMTGEDEPKEFVLLRFDALNKKISAAALAPETVVLANGKAISLSDAAAQAGPAQASFCLSETLGIKIDHYLYSGPQQMITITKDFAPAHLPLMQYLTKDAVQELNLDFSGVQTLAFTPKMFSDVLHQCHATPAARVMLRTEGYLDFLRANPDALAEDLPDAVRRELGRLSSNLSATDIFDYERIFGFLQRETPDYQPVSLPGKWNSRRFEFIETSADAAKAAFGSAQSESESSSPRAASDRSADSFCTSTDSQDLMHSTLTESAAEKSPQSESEADPALPRAGAL